MSTGTPQRHANRMVLVQFLYMMEMNPPLVLAEEVRNFFENQDNPREYYEFAEEVLAGILDKLEAIDAKIHDLATNWEFDRIAKTDLAILRLGIFEMLYREDVPPVVVIDEAVELSREFSSDQSNTFINGILDNVMQDVDRDHREKVT
jgi:N utilization substance protein B